MQTSFQTEIDWSQSVHQRENNFRSQCYRDENFEGLGRQNRIIYKALLRGDRPNNDHPYVFNEETGQMERIGALPRRILDISDHIKKLGLKQSIESKQMAGSKFCEYFLKFNQ